MSADPILTDTARGLARRVTHLRSVLKAYGIDWESRDLSDCAYYRDPAGTCSHGCWEEPRCVTEEPSEGWPVARVRHALGLSIYDDLNIGTTAVRAVTDDEAGLS